jgi:tRNA-dihydrouridine synthase B
MPNAIEIGTVRIWPPVVQAPMSALTTLPMRTLAEEMGCGLTVTEFLPAPALAGGVKAMISRLTPSKDNRPFGVQIFGRDPKQMAKAAGMAADRGAAIVDINMGCPARKVTKGVCGSALMREPELAETLVIAIKEEIGTRAAVTVKIRAGWDNKTKNAPAFAARMVEAGARAVTVHGRTREQKFEGVVDLDIIRHVKKEVQDVPIIANGDIVDIASLERTLETTDCDGVAIGRAALGNPWIFARFAAWFDGLPIPAFPTGEQRIAMYLKHLELYLQTAVEEKAVIEMRKFAGWYLKSMPNISSLRQGINQLRDVASIHQLIEDYRVKYLELETPAKVA